jgi:transcriptional activator HAC1
MVVLRWVSSEGRDVERVFGGDEFNAAAAVGGSHQQQQQRAGDATWPNGAALPSKEVLLTLLWALNVEERRVQIRERNVVLFSSGRPGSQSVLKSTSTRTNQTYVLNVVPKRALEEVEHLSLDKARLKRRWLG